VAERGLAGIMGRPVMPHRDQIHAVHAVGAGFICMAAACTFATRDLIAVARHVAENQFTVVQWSARETPR